MSKITPRASRICTAALWDGCRCPRCNSRSPAHPSPAQVAAAHGDRPSPSGCGASSHVEFGRKENLVGLWNTRTHAPFLPMEEWDRRDEAVLLLVDYSDGEHAIDDATVAITIGHNNDHNVGKGEGEGWLFAGWCWSHDHYTQGKGQPIGWMPLPHHLARAREARP